MRDTDDKTMDFLKSQQRIALVETIDMMTAHSRIKQAVRYYAHGLPAVAARAKSIAGGPFSSGPKDHGPGG